jgi:hypothetical protein
MAISRDYTAEPRAVWIDAICINQADEDEKRKQIPPMGEIYGFADVVYCSLPPTVRQSVMDRPPLDEEALWDRAHFMLKALAFYSSARADSYILSSGKNPSQASTLHWR